MPDVIRPCLRVLLVAGLLPALLPASVPPAPAGQPFFHHYTPADYGKSEQVWAAVEDSRGLRYFGNSHAVLVFDGETWRTVDVPSCRYVRALGVGPDDTVYVAGDDDFGYLQPNATGQLGFVSLLPLLPEAERAKVSTLFCLKVTAQGAFFSSAKYLIRWHDGQLHWWPLTGGRSSSLLVVDGELLVQRLQQGLFRIVGDELKSVSDDPLLNRGLIRSVVPLSDGSQLAFSGHDGLFRWPPGGAPCMPWVNAVGNPQLADLFPAAAVGLPNGDIAVGTVLAGLMIFSPDGKLQLHLDENNGLGSASVYQLAVDREGELWVCTGNGLVRLDVTTAMRFHGAADGLPHATVRALARHEGRLHAVTVNRFFTLDEATGHFDSQLLPGECFAILSHPGGLLVSAEYDVLLAAPSGSFTRVAHVPDMITGFATSLADPNRVWVVHRTGLNALRWNGQSWQDEGQVAHVEANCNSVAEDAAGQVWLGSPARGVARVRLAAPTPDRLTLASRATAVVLTAGLPAGFESIDVKMLPGGKVMLVTARGLYELDDAGERFVPVMRFGAQWSNGTQEPGNVAVAGADELWFDATPLTPAGEKAGPAVIGRAIAAGPAWAVLPRYVPDRIGAVLHTFYDPANPRGPTVWLAGPDGLASVETRWQPAPRALPVLLRRVTAGGGRQILGGVTLPAAPPGLAYADRNLRFEFAAPRARAGAPVEYAVQLEGLDPAWSAWQRESFKEFTNLPEGRYTLRVRARQEGVTGTSDGFAFGIAPPLARTPAAYALYALVAAGAVFGLVRWRVAVSERERRRLEKIVAERTAELVIARDAAEAASRAKGAFLASMSHELRTPLHIILGYARVLGRDPAIDATGRAQLASLGASGEHLLHLVNEVLDLAKVEAGKLQLRPAPCDLPRLVTTLGELFRQQAADRGLALTLDVDPALPARVLTDEQKLAQVLFNLLGNAVKFTAHGSVMLSVSALPDGRTAFAVADTGPGIAPTDQARLFQPFEQTASGAAAGGTGLGLALSQRLVTLLGGDLQVASTPDAGSTFSFVLALPIAPAAAAGDPRTITGYDGPPRRVLVVDDHPANRDILSRQLTPLGFAVRIAATGAEALQLHDAEPADLVLLDLRMAPMDGFATARALRAAPGGDRVKIIALSASVFDEEEASARAAGCDAFLPKPCDETLLLDTIGRQLGLTWQHAAPAPTVIPSVSSSPLPVAVIVELRAYADRGAVQPFLARVAELKSVRLGADALLDELQALAAQFQMQKLRELLATLPPAP